MKKHIIEYQAGVRVAEKIITFIWDGWELLYERHQLPSGLTTLERKYLWGPDICDGAAGGAGGLLLIRETKGNTTTEIIPLYDGTGHVAALTNINKDLLASYAYGPFGEKISATGPKANSNPWRFQTKYLDEETGLYYFGKRYYDPITGQWLSREILGESESLNLYTLTGNDPVNHVDVRGLATVAVNGGLSTSLDSIFGILTDDYLPEPESTATIPSTSNNTKDLEWLAYFADYVEANALPLPEIDWSADHSIDLWAMNAPVRQLDEAADTGRFDDHTTEMLRLTSQGRSNGEADYNLVSGTTNGLLFFTQPEAAVFKAVGVGLLAVKGVRMGRGLLMAGDEALELCVLGEKSITPELRVIDEIIAPGSAGLNQRAYLNQKFGRTGNLHADINARQESLYQRLATQHMNGSGQTQLGVFSGVNENYIQRATRLDRNYFDIGNYWHKIPKVERWGVNERFLKSVTDSGDQIFFNISKSKIRPSNRYSLMEIDYLTNKAGYRWVNQWSLIKEN